MRLRVNIQAKHSIKYLEAVARKFQPWMIDAMNKLSENMTSWVKRAYLSGSPLGERSGELKNSTIPILVSSRGKLLVGGVKIGSSKKASKYVGVHVSARPKTTVIKSRNKLLTIPLPRAMDSRGIKKMSARDVPNSTVRTLKNGKYKGSYILGSKSKNGRITPYFILADQVKIESSVYTEDIMRKYQPYITRALNSTVSRIIK